MVYRDETEFDSSKDWTIDELSKFILEKKYGKDVRSVIAYALAKSIFCANRRYDGFDQSKFTI